MNSLSESLDGFGGIKKKINLTNLVAIMSVESMGVI